MAKDKKSVLVYVDWITTFEELEDDEAGRLIKHFFRYVNDLNPEPPDRLTKLVFENIKAQLKRDLKAYEQTCNKNKENAEKRWQQKNATAYDGIKSHQKNADTDNDTDNDTDIELSKDNSKESLLPKYQSDFFDSLIPLVDEFGKETCRDFYDYWTEPNKSKTKIRWQLEKTWDLRKRITRWSNNNFKKSNGGKQQERSVSERSVELDGIVSAVFASKRM